MMCEVDEFAEMAADPKGAAAATIFEAANEAEEEGTATGLCGQAADMLASEFTRGELDVRIPFEVPLNASLFPYGAFTVRSFEGSSTSCTPRDRST
jgi:hypothetical protein